MCLFDINFTIKDTGIGYLKSVLQSTKHSGTRLGSGTIKFKFSSFRHDWQIL